MLQSMFRQTTGDVWTKCYHDTQACN